MTGYYFYLDKTNKVVMPYMANSKEEMQKIKEQFKGRKEFKRLCYVEGASKYVQFQTIVEGLNKMFNIMHKPIKFTYGHLHRNSIALKWTTTDNSTMTEELYSILKNVLTTFKLTYEYNSINHCLYVYGKEVAYDT